MAKIRRWEVKREGKPANTVPARWRPWSTVRNLAGVLEFGPRDHYRAREKHRKREKLKANSLETKTWARMD
jgi:hypothetical protein